MSANDKFKILAKLTETERHSLADYLNANRNALVPMSRQSNRVAPFPDWLKEVSPSFHWDWAYLRYIQNQLARVTSGDIKRLMLFVPPRHGKTEMTTIRYPVYRLERNPEMRIIVGAYNQDLAENFTRKSRRIARERLELSKEKALAGDWETSVGGGLRASGVGVGIAGRGAQLIVIDDPVKNREEANSPTYRQRVWDWWKDDLYTRLEPNGAMILIMTRWHTDDLAGRILSSEFGNEWTVIKFPAIAEREDELGRKAGEALCPARFDLPALDNLRKVLGYSFYSLYQQSPMPAEGGFFKRGWFEIIPALQHGPWWWVRYWDFAATKSKRADSTAGVLMGLHQTLRYFVVADVQHGQWDGDERDKIIRQTAALDRQRFGNVQIWREREPGSSGVDAAKAFIRSLSGYPVFAELPRGSKTARAETMQSQAMVQNIKVLSGAWNNEYLDCLAGFPFGHDDMVDGSSGAFRRLNVIAEREAGQHTEEAPGTGEAQYISMRGQV